MGLFTARMERLRNTYPVPPCALVNRDLWPGTYPFLQVLPLARESPAMPRVCQNPQQREALLTSSKVRVSLLPGFAFINTRVPCIMLSWTYLASGSHADLYLDLLHELTHLRQLSEGAELWDQNFSYVDRITEIEGYAVAVEEGRRIGLSEAMLHRHLHNPWMSTGDVTRLKGHIQRFLGTA